MGRSKRRREMESRQSAHEQRKQVDIEEDGGSTTRSKTLRLLQLATEVIPGLRHDMYLAGSYHSFDGPSELVSTSVSAENKKPLGLVFEWEVQGSQQYTVKAVVTYWDDGRIRSLNVECSCPSGYRNLLRAGENREPFVCKHALKVLGESEDPRIFERDQERQQKRLRFTTESDSYDDDDDDDDDDNDDDDDDDDDESSSRSATLRMLQRSEEIMPGLARDMYMPGSRHSFDGDLQIMGTCVTAENGKHLGLVFEWQAQGHNDYYVKVKSTYWDDGRMKGLYVSCTCPSGQQMGVDSESGKPFVCKHARAALIESEDHRSLE